MPSFAGHAISDAPPEEIWKLLYDPARMPDWWAGVERVRGVQVAGGDTRFELFTASDPELPMPQLLRGEPGRVVISCLTLDARFDWRLTPEQEGTRIDVEFELPEERAGLLDVYSESAAASAQNLARLAEREYRGG